MEVILKDRRHVHPRTAKRNARLREILAEIRYNNRWPTYGEKVAEIERRYGISRAQATEAYDECDKYAPEHLAANASRIKARLLLGAESALEKGEGLIDGSRDAAAIAQARANLAKTIQDIDPNVLLTGPDALTAVLLALSQCELSEEQEAILRARYEQEDDDGE